MKYVLLLRGLALAALTPLLEKNVAKTFAVDIPLVFSMGRVVVLAFCIGMLRHLWHASVIGWPDATLSMTVVLALPVFSALDRVTPERVVDLASGLFGRFGIGGAGSVAAQGQEPSKFDDHRNDR